MNNSEFISELARRTELTTRETTNLMEGLIAELSYCLEEEDVVSIQSFGVFSTKKKLERVVVNPLSKLRMLVPPKMVINFKVSPVLKEKLKD